MSIDIDTTGRWVELDTHFLAVFTPADLIGGDGRKHEKVMS